MSINSVGSLSTFQVSPGKSLLDMNQKKLDDNNVTNLQDGSNAAKQTFVGEIKGINFTKSVVNSTHVDLNDCYGNIIDYNSFNSCIDNMGSLSDDEKTTLKNAVNTASDTLMGRQMNGGTGTARISQTNVELKYISEKLVPEDYQDRFNSLIDDYTDKLYDSMSFYDRNFAEQLKNTTDPALIKTGWQKRGEKFIEQMDQGTYITQTSKAQYQRLYNGIDTSEPNKVKDQLGSVYQDILTNGTVYSGGDTKDSLSDEVKYLSEKWNKVMDAMGESNNMKFTTSVNYLA
jgi:hypothetical protein